MEKETNQGNDSRDGQELGALETRGGNLLQAYWTFGRYDAVVILEAPNEKTALKALMRGGDHLSIETLLAIPRAEAVKLLD